MSPTSLRYNTFFHQDNAHVFYEKKILSEVYGVFDQNLWHLILRTSINKIL